MCDEMLARLWLVVALLGGHGSSYRLLGFHPIPGQSQHNIFYPLLRGLAERNHTVVYLTPVAPDSSHPYLEVRLIPQFKQELHAAIGVYDMDKVPHPEIPHRLYVGGEAVAEQMYGHPITQSLIHSNEHYDAVILESSIVQEPASALIHKFSCPGIDISTLGNMAWLNEVNGLPSDPVYVPDAKSDYSDKMNFWQRLYNAYITWSTVLVSYYHLHFHLQGIMDKYFNYTGWETRPPIGQLLANRSLVLINQNVVTDYPVALAPHMKQIGGINIVPNKPLPETLKKWMDGAKDGVILFSLGSNLNTSEVMSTIVGPAFLPVFRELPQRVIMKWEADERPKGMPSNIFFHKWIPQQDVLAHKNCRLFVTHGGLLSLTESLYHGVPVLGIPFFWDQFKNLHHAQTAGYGERLKLDNITVESVRWALSALLNDPRYKSEAERRQSLLRDERHSAVDEAVYWIEHTIKYPNSLTPQSVYLSFIALHNIDIFIFIAVTAYIFYLGVKFVVKSIVSSLKSSAVKKKRE